MNKNSKIYVAGGTGLVGSAIIRKLLEKGYKNIVSTYHKRKPENLKIVKWVKLDLTSQYEVEKFFKKEKPEYVFLAAARVGGIWANNIYRADFIYQNLQIQNNVIHYSYLYDVKKLLFLGSTCIYPKKTPQPIKEEYLLTGPIEYTNEPYAIAKIAGLKMCENYNLQYGTNFIAVMPTNIYGINDNFDLETSHVLPALLRKIHLAKALEDENWDLIKKDLNKRPIENIDGNKNKKEILGILDKYGIKLIEGKVKVEIWGTGKPRREFLWADDLADACVFLMEKISFEDIVKLMYPNIKNITEEYPYNEIRNIHINIGTGTDISIKELANLIKTIVDFKGGLFFNPQKPDGVYRKLTDVSRLHTLGWRHKTELHEGVKKLYDWYIQTL